MPQQRHRAQHHIMLMTIKLPTTIPMIAGHLQYPFAMQLSQLENVFLTLLTSLMPEETLFAAPVTEFAAPAAEEAAVLPAAAADAT